MSASSFDTLYIQLKTVHSRTVTTTGFHLATLKAYMSVTENPMNKRSTRLNVYAGLLVRTGLEQSTGKQVHWSQVIVS